jgi:hypothetical protein
MRTSLWRCARLRQTAGQKVATSAESFGAGERDVKTMLTDVRQALHNEALGRR